MSTMDIYGLITIDGDRIAYDISLHVSAFINPRMYETRAIPVTLSINLKNNIDYKSYSGIIFIVHDYSVHSELIKLAKKINSKYRTKAVIITKNCMSSYENEDIIICAKSINYYARNYDDIYRKLGSDDKLLYISSLIYFMLLVKKWIF